MARGVDEALEGAWTSKEGLSLSGSRQQRGNVWGVESWYKYSC